MFSAIDPRDPVGVPPPRLNGGLYTGEPFRRDAPWGNIPVVPDAALLQRDTLLSAGPPPGVVGIQYASDARPGNNTPILTFEARGFAPLSPGWSTWVKNG